MTNSMGRAIALLTLSCSLGLGACASDRALQFDARDDRGPQGASAAISTFDLPAGWQRASPLRFEQLLAAWPPVATAEGANGEESLPAPALYTELATALDVGDASSMRAALLAHALDDAHGQELLLARLEARRPSPKRALDAVDVVCAAALFGKGLERGYGARLAALATGPTVHPDLEVRVECARSALAAGRDEVLPFLVKVLRAGTPAERSDPIDWPSRTTMAWAKTRASACLAERAGVPNDFRPDSSFADQMAAATRFAERLELDG